ncbi:hypothetical protein BC833DRAFT_606762 [Globomyces pollinis-pini]|nr:hypothetical protein BC833DRAFT_606762 [Globomyces pollinis-pini]KAJ2999556.1 hypothetical protein HDV02_002521 [Globomyces sp. JEL0801]
MPLEPLISFSVSLGSLFTGFSLVLNSQIIFTNGIPLSFKNDESRQNVLSTLMFISSICYLFLYPIIPTTKQITLINLLILIINTCLHFSLIIVNHNSLGRYRIANNSTWINLIFTNFKFFYLIPFLTLIPLYIGVGNATVNQNYVMRSFYYSQIFEPINILMIFSTILISVFIDILVLLPLVKVEKNSKPKSDSISKNKNTFIRLIWMDYFTIWLLLILNIVMKYLLAFGVSLTFDGIITITMLTYRCRCNLRFIGLLRNLLSESRLPLRSNQYFSSILSTNFQQATNRSLGSTNMQQATTRTSITSVSRYNGQQFYQLDNLEISTDTKSPNLYDFSGFAAFIQPEDYKFDISFNTDSNV